MTTAEINAQMQQKLESLGIPADSIRVFGAIRCNVHVVCVGRESAIKWQSVLAKVFKAKVFVGEHCWKAVENKGTCLLPTLRHGFLVTVAA